MSVKISVDTKSGKTTTDKGVSRVLVDITAIVEASSSVEGDIRKSHLVLHPIGEVDFALNLKSGDFECNAHHCRVVTIEAPDRKSYHQHILAGVENT